ncbi:guanylate kinase [Mycoplasma sp. ATU-Cv-508]|uniref:guanylate kinase n=1 Tax=Mycoplasma sp. ATU-Cv-508 TaxID=2048001 RepID=UPI001F3BABDB
MLGHDSTSSFRRNQGRHYYFLSEKEFNEKVKKNEFFEWNQHFFHKYGTLKSELERISKLGYVPFLEIDVEGAKQIINSQTHNYRLVTIFIMPPSVAELERRIRERATESEVQLKERLVRYNKEIADSKLFEHVIVNDDLDKVVAKIKKIVQAK